MWSARRPYHFKFFRGCFPQISLGPFFNTLFQIVFTFLCSFILYLMKEKKPWLKSVTLLFICKNKRFGYLFVHR